MQTTAARELQNFAKHAAYFSVLCVLLGAAFFGQSLAGINIFDEGFIVSGAMLVSDGNLPYRDFLSMYGPGQYYVTAAVFALLGEELVFVRYLHVLLLTALGMTIHALAKEANARPGRALLVLLGYVGIVLFAKPSVGYPAITATLFLLISGVGLTKWSRTARISSLVFASCMIGFAGLFRWDFGIFGLLALAATLTILTMRDRIKADYLIPFFSTATAAFGPALLILAAVYIPLLVVFSDPARWYQEVLLFSLNEFEKWRNLEFVRPAYWRLFDGAASSFSNSILRLTYLGLPVLLVVGAVATVIHSLLFRRDKPLTRDRLDLIVYLAFICLFLLNQMRVRPGLWQGFPAVVASLPLIVLLWDYHRALISRRLTLSLALGTTGFVIGALLFNVALDAMFAPRSERLLEFDTPKTTGIRIEPERKPYIDLVNYVHDNTRPGEPIYSGVKDHSRLFVNDAMLYFLVDHPPADRFLELEPGISNTRAGQQEIIDALARKKVRLIVLSDILSDEPNRTSRSNGVRILDEFIRANYHFYRDFGNQAVFIRD